MKPQILLLLKELRKKCVERDMVIVKRMGISMAQHNFFVASIDVPDLNLTKLAHALELSQSRLSRVVDKMVQDGYIERSGCNKDRRAISLCYTNKGEIGLEQVKSHRSTCELRLRENLSPQFDEQLLTSLKFLIKNI